MINLGSMLRLLRPKQWVKNGFVCTGALFGASVHDVSLIQAMIFAVVSFCLIGSCVYIINDYSDAESDRLHPKKRERPLASGAVTPAQALVLGAMCASLSLVTAVLADRRVLMIVCLYLAINIAYSKGLKHLAVVDVFCIALGFMLRIMAGTWGIHIKPSGWLMLTGMFVTLFLGFAKRRAEWTEAVGGHLRRPVLGIYSKELLDTYLSVTATGTVISYGLYTFDSKTIALHHTDKLIYTLPIVLFGLFRYLFLLHSENRGENPSVDVFTDYQLLMCGLAFAGMTSCLLIQ
jgi:4-hydroxybenzoate polyprenyltransferase